MGASCNKKDSKIKEPVFEHRHSGVQIQEEEPVMTNSTFDKLFCPVDNLTITDKRKEI